MRARFSASTWAGRWLIATCSIGVFIAACTTDYQKGLEDPLYGDPNALAGKKQPGPTSEVVTEAGAGGNNSAPACGAPIDGGACAVSFKTILAAFKTAGCQTAQCHAAGFNPPAINPDDSTAMWISFTNFKLTNGVLYVNPCSQDPNQSGIQCNCNAAAPCGTRAMPPGIGLPANVLADIDTWQKCGAPNN